MKSYMQRFLCDYQNRSRQFLCIACFILLIIGVPDQSFSEPSQIPLFVTQSASPLVMLNLSNDNQLYFNAYPEYADLTGNGVPEGGYNHGFDYFGYFDSYKCYVYEDNRFKPDAAVDSDKYCSDDDHWSGNFLNWLTMARIDTVRKILYGGHRSVDDTDLTVLERTYLPNDAHSWVRYYDGDDLHKLSPFSSNDASHLTSSSLIIVPSPPPGERNHTDYQRDFDIVTGWLNTPDVQLGDQLEIRASLPGNILSDETWMRGVVISADFGSQTIKVQVTSSGGAGDSFDDWHISNESRRGVSFCNTTVSSTKESQNVSDPPLLRVARGDYALWTANERWQCRWYEEKDGEGHSDMLVGGEPFSNGNDISASGLWSNSENPVRDQVGLDLDNYHVKVEVCNSAHLDTENCKEYPNSGNDPIYKPVGLLQDFSADPENAINFGMMTGSYTNNLSGGVLRKNAQAFSDEVNPQTGQFIVPSSGESIVRSLNALRLYGYNHDTGVYSGAEDNCGVGIRLADMTDGRCMNWGNPQAEIFAESLRYLAGLSPNSDFNVTGTDQLSGLQNAVWNDPISNENWCSPLNVIQFNTSFNSFDNNVDSAVSGLGFGSTGIGSIDDFTNLVGAGENINGEDVFVGGTNRLCTAKELAGLADFAGICPEAPNQNGTYSIAGLSHFAYTNSIRNDLTEEEQFVKTFGVSLAPAVPRIEIPKQGETIPSIVILPALENVEDGGLRGALADFRIIEQDIASGTGTFFVQWDVHEWGSDFDMDINGTLSYQITENEITITTDVWSQSSSRDTGFGYIVSGSTEDGFHAHSGINGYSGSYCANCTINDPPSSRTYTLGGDLALLLNEPLYYAAKWAGYDKDLDFPNDQSSWDATGSGLPDNYYYATNPAALASSLSEVFENIAETTSSAAAVASNSTSLDTDTLIYQARFNTTDWFGELRAFNVSTVDGSASDTPAWEAEDQLPEPADRNIVTFDPAATVKGRVFTWDGLTAPLQTFLNDDAFGTTDARGEDRVNWLRGADVNDFRTRENKIGDIVNSNPFFMGKPDLRYYTLSPEGAEYIDFRSTTEYENRSPVLFIGANDGKLHAFHAETGEELFAYVPYTVFPQLSRLTDPGYGSQTQPELAHRFYVDGSPRVGDVYFSNTCVDDCWRSVLVGTLGAGGKGLFALDVTNPDTFGSSNVLWEVNSTTTTPDYSQMGYTIGEAAIGRMANDKWAAIVGNGFESANGHAVLYIIDIENGNIIESFSFDTSGDNGMASPLAVDLTGNRIVDRIYVGDLKGNMWVVDVDDVSSSKWDSAYLSGGTPVPLFTARGPDGEVQPITSRADAANHPSGGVMVYFGTGSFYQEGDNQVPALQSDRETQSFYGIRDNTSINNPSTIDNTRDEFGVYEQLQQQEIIFEGTVGPSDVRALTSNNVDYGQKKGWYLDLVSPAPVGKQEERVVSRPLLRHGRVIFSTLIPSTHACEFGGSSWLMELDALSGGRLAINVFDINEDGVIDEQDYVQVGDELIPVSGLRSKVGIIQTPRTVLRRTTDNLEYKYMTGSSGDILTVTEEGGDTDQFGRRSWRQLQ